MPCNSEKESHQNSLHSHEAPNQQGINSCGKKVAIIQSNYIPWKGYFDLINMVDEFILYDDMQYTRRDWRNRNKIKERNGAQWITIPVQVKGKYYQKICDTIISDKEWAHKHWSAIVHNYSRSEHFSMYSGMLEHLYFDCTYEHLSDINYRFISAICKMLDINTELSWSMDYKLEGDKSEKLLNICKQAKAVEYISGPSAKSYIDEELFRSEGVILKYMDYSGYPEYNQLYPPFDHYVSILDLILNMGPNAKNYMLSF